MTTSSPLDGDLQGLGLGVDLLADPDLAFLDRMLLGVQALFLDLDGISRAMEADRDVPFLEPGIVATPAASLRSAMSARVLMS